MNCPRSFISRDGNIKHILSARSLLQFQLFFSLSYFSQPPRWTLPRVLSCMCVSSTSRLVDDRKLFRKRQRDGKHSFLSPSTSPPARTMTTAAEDVPTLSVTLLGAGQEVGRSCCVLQYRGKTVVCDAGIHPAYNGMASLPFVDELDWSTVDALLITQ